jgi:hypothetical protein
MLEHCEFAIAPAMDEQIEVAVRDVVRPHVMQVL